MDDELEDFYDRYAAICREMGVPALPEYSMVALMQMILAGEVAGVATVH